MTLTPPSRHWTVSRRRGWRPRAVSLVAAGTLVAAFGCTDSPSPANPAGQGDQWAAAAEAYLDAWEAANVIGFTNAAPFWTPDARVDMRELNGFDGTGRPAILQNDRDWIQIPPRFYDGWDQADAGGSTPVGPIYLSREVGVQVSYIPDLKWYFADLSTVTSRGVVEMTDAMSIDAAGRFCDVVPTDLDALVDGYVDAWASGERTRVGELYADGAVLRDSIADIAASGTTAIANLGAADPAKGGLPGAVLPEFPDDGGRAYFINGPFLQGAYPVDQLVLLLDVGPEGGCPGPVAVFLDLDDQKRITHEERFHRIDALRRCLPTEDRPTGWWDEARIPETLDIRLTGWVSATPHDIAIWNGDARVDPIVEWARTRFASLGLPPPRPSSVTFLPSVEGDRWETFGFLTGSDAPDLGLPFTGPEACPDGPCRWSTAVRAATLHEFAHLWLTPKRYSGRASYDLPRNWKSETRITRFLEAHDLTWHDPNLPWGQQGGERAAETIAWGLMDQPYTVDARLGPLTCAQLTTDFQNLTNTTPDPRACAEPGEVIGGVP